MNEVWCTSEFSGLTYVFSINKKDDQSQKVKNNSSIIVLDKEESKRDE